jgi:hypothetical protein
MQVALLQYECPLHVVLPAREKVVTGVSFLFW